MTYISKIIKSKTSYKEYFEKFFYSTLTNREGTRKGLINFLKRQSENSISYLETTIKLIDSQFELNSENESDISNQIEVKLNSLSIYELVSIVSFIYTKNKGVYFYGMENINLVSLQDDIKELFFSNKNIWEIDSNNLFSLNSIFDCQNGYLLLFNTSGKKIYFLNKNLEYINDSEPGYVSLYISNTGFISIGGLQDKKKIDNFLNLIEDKLNLKIKVNYNLLIFSEIFESKANRISRKGDKEIKGKNYIQNNSTGSDLSIKTFYGDTTKVGGYFNIEGFKDEINIGFSGNNLLSISKNNISYIDYVAILEFFFKEIITGEIKSPDFHDLFKFKIGGKEELLKIKEDDIFENYDNYIQSVEDKYHLKFSAFVYYECINKKCSTYNSVLYNAFINGEKFNCKHCTQEYDLEKIDIKGYYLNFDDNFYNNLFDDNFIDNDFDNSKKAEYEYISKIDSEQYNIHVMYGNYNKNKISKNKDSNKIIIFLSPCNKDSSIDFFISDFSNKNIYLKFDLGMFDILKHDASRSKLFDEIISKLKNQNLSVVNYNTTNINNSQLRDINNNSNI